MDEIGDVLAQDVLDRFAMFKHLEYNEDYDGITSEKDYFWLYEVSKWGGGVTSPSGESSSDDLIYYTAGQNWDSGLAYQSGSPGVLVERMWAKNLPVTISGSGPYYPTSFQGTGSANAYVKTELTTFADSNGAVSLDSKTAVKDFKYDKNGNVLEIKEYDFVTYGSITRTGGQVTGLPSLTLRRKTVNTYYYQAADAETATANSYSYSNPSAPRLLNLIKSSEVQNSSGMPISRVEYYYDGGTSTPDKGNLTETRSWDNQKGSYSSPLTTGEQGNSISIFAEYDSYGNVMKTIDAKGVETTITYGSIPVPSTTPVSGLYPTMTEVASNHSSVTRTSTSTYDYYTGLVTSTTDEDNDLTNATEYDDLGRPVKVITALGTALESWTVTNYDSEERRVIVKSDVAVKGDGKKVAVQHYDELGRVRLTRTLENPDTESAADEQHGIKVQTRYGYDDPSPSEPDDPQDSLGSYTLVSNPYRATSSSGASGEPTMGWTLSYVPNTGTSSFTTTYEGAGLPAAFGGSNSSTTGTVTTVRDSDRTLVTDQAGKQRMSRTNALGHLTDVWEVLPSSLSGSVSVAFPGASVAYAYKTSYTYDLLNNLTHVEQGDQDRYFEYSSLSRLLSAENPESGEIHYEYDNNGNLTEKTDARGIITSYSYDALNRVTQRAYAAPSPTPSNYQTTPMVTYTYGTTAPKVGKLIKVDSAVSTTEYTSFDILGRVTGHKQTTDGQEYVTDYTYNLSGALTEQTYPSGRKVQNVLDSNGDLSVVKSKKNPTSGSFHKYAFNFVYNAAGAVSSMELGNLRYESTVFNSRLQPTQIALGTTNSGSQAYDKLKLNYTYGTTNNNGNVLTQKITVAGTGGFTADQTYSYDSLNRLLTAEEMPEGWSDCTSDPTKCWKQTFTYDRYGNRRFDEGNTSMPASFSNPAVTNPTISTSNNRLTSTGYSYDSSGNMTADAESRTFIYDAENKQVQVSNGSGTIGQYWYDGDGKRVKKFVPGTGETTIFVYDAAGKLVAEYSTIVEPIETAKVAYLTNDHLGSPRINTDKNGNVTARHDYHPFGEEIATSQRTAGLGYTDDTVRQQFTGYERDIESDLDYAQARYYAKNLGRFNSPDPLLTSGRIHVPQSWNKYSYVLGNPLKYSDPLGLYEYADGTSEDDKKRIKKAYDKLVEARDKFKEGSKKYNEINKALTTLGKPGEANGVFIFVDNTQATPGRCVCGPQLGSDGKMTGKADIWIGLNLNSGNKDSVQLAGTLGHEGRHAADHQSEAAKLTGMSITQFNEFQAKGQVMPRAITEVNAYRVSSYIAEAISPSNVANVSVNGSEIWNRSWKAVDQDANRDKGIIGVLEAPTGSYKFKFTSDPKSANNSIDNPALWTTNGGPIF